ncbi:unnamed protein product [Candidula unifasciata]|uniref:Ependymin-like protein n=1 Tax=Candidula unifasciata TaxID=100452 RepID=A0A8S3Z5P2_9EUPU|nr:unnamed protein product [Candidula unifasciata]
MLFAVIASAVLGSVLGAARDPTKVCLPDKFQALIFAFQNDITGLIAFDFPNERISVRTTSNGLRIVYNLTDDTALSINETDGKCIQLPKDLKLQTIATRCLPANAVQLGNVSTYIGVGSTQTKFEGWELQFPGIGTVTAAVTTTTPAIPILRQFVSADGKDRESVFFFNVQTTIDDNSIFNVPDVCSPATVVGK